MPPHIPPWRTSRVVAADAMRWCCTSAVVSKILGIAASDEVSFQIDSRMNREFCKRRTVLKVVSQAVIRNLPFHEVMFVTTDHIDVRLSGARPERAGLRSNRISSSSIGRPGSLGSEKVELRH